MFVLRQPCTRLERDMYFAIKKSRIFLFCLFPTECSSELHRCIYFENLLGKAFSQKGKKCNTTSIFAKSKKILFTNRQIYDIIYAGFFRKISGGRLYGKQTVIREAMEVQNANR